MHLLGSTAHVQAVLLAASGPEGVAAPLQRVGHLDSGLGAAAGRGGGQAAGVTAGVDAPVIIRVCLDVIADALLGVGFPHCLAHVAALRGDDDDAVRRGRAIQCRRRGPLHNLDALDILGVEVVQPGNRLPAHVEADVVRAVGDTNAVHHEQGLVGQRNAAGAANADLRAGTNRAAGIDDLDARRTALNQARDAGRLARLNRVGHVDPRDAVHDLALARLAGGGHHQVVQAYDGRAQREVCRPAAARHGEHARERLVTDGDDANGHSTVRHIAELVASLVVGCRLAVGALEEQARALERLPGALIGDPATDGGALLS